MEKYILNYKRSLKLKILGYKEESIGYYYPKNDKQIFQYYIGITTQDKYTTLAPTYEQAFNFFREQYNILPVIEKVDGYYRGWYTTEDEKYVEFMEYKDYYKLREVILDSVIEHNNFRGKKNETDKRKTTKDI